MTNKLLVTMHFLPFLIALLITLMSCQEEKEPVLIVNNGTTQGTTYHIVYESPDSINYQQSIDSLLVAFDRSMSTYNDSSLITAINKSDTGGYVDEHFITIYHKALEVHYASDKLFDITVWPLVSAYGFGDQKPADIGRAKIDSIIQYIGMQKIKLEGDRLSKADKNVQLDVNAIAKGYSVDLVSTFLNSKGIRNHLVEIGGEVYASGKKGDVHWRVGIDKPVENNLTPGANLQAIVNLENIALATSGNYRRFYEKNGRKIVHTINPKTGNPEIHHLLSATIVAPDCMTADAYATACMVMGLEKSKTLLNRNPEIEGYLIYNDETGNDKVYRSEGMGQFIDEDSID